MSQSETSDETEHGHRSVHCDIVDFSQIVCFAIAGGGEPFCFDFRESPNPPSVIWWDDVFWRKVSPEFEAFLQLFDLDGGI